MLVNKMETASKEFIPYTASSMIAQNDSVCWKVSARVNIAIQTPPVFLPNGESPAYYPALLYAVAV